MPSDDFDKTIFRQPSVNSDRTVVRPTPGGGRGGHPQQPSASSRQDSIPSSSGTDPSTLPQSTQYRPKQQGQNLNESAAACFSTSSGLNPLVNAASTLIAVFEKTRQALSHADVGGLHERLINEIKLFENSARDVGIKPEIVLSARYIICAALDEAVLNTPWGSESAWPQRTLLSVFHNETSGGEKFFQILDRMKEQPAEHLFILEFMYIFLSLGFEGKYRVIHRGRDMIEHLRDDLFMMIRHQRGEYERSLSPNWQGLGKSRSSLDHYLPMWVLASIVGAILLVSYSGFRLWLFESSLPVIEKLDEIADTRTINQHNSGKSSSNNSAQ